MWNGAKISRRLHRELASLLIEFGCKALKHDLHCCGQVGRGRASRELQHVGGGARTIYVGAEEPTNASVFNQCHLQKAGEILSDILDGN
jgi:hypothetical protein